MCVCVCVCACVVNTESERRVHLNFARYHDFVNISEVSAPFCAQVVVVFTSSDHY